MHSTVGSEPAHKVRIREILEGEFEDISLNQVRYFRMPWGSISRVRVLGLVISSWKSDDGSFARLEVHDGTGSVQVKAWEEDVYRMVDPSKGELYDVGSLVDIIGRIRSWKDTVYLYPLLISKVSDPNTLLLRELEILRRMLRYSAPPPKSPRREDSNATIIRLLKELGPLSPEEIADLLKWSMDEVTGRLTELADLGLIYEDGGRYVYVGQR